MLPFVFDPSIGRELFKFHAQPGAEQDSGRDHSNGNFLPDHPVGIDLFGGEVHNIIKNLMINGL